ncbi:MAG TPA: DEAD/DEAH box helicase [Candidatus Marinimicrobia bacterium]|nr:DEAD/DEAH box helicase [Candidatus Neomarinimicrobiota bacterium]HQF37119.1 DEAD/DEAH box helicase [Candidatus Dojkabacteria bacterium]
MDDIKNYLISNNWNINYEYQIPEKNGEYFNIDDIGLSQSSKKYLSIYKLGIYKHQKLAITKFLSGRNICITTSTSSGKSLTFYVIAMELLSKKPDSKIMAIYPLKALGTEQTERWESAFRSSGLDISVGRIDGGIPVKERINIIKNNQIIIFTPDIIHAWMLSNISTKAIINFLSNVEAIIVDEAHVYSGVFGSNSAFLYRRLNNICASLNKIPKYICASATIKNPEVHMKNLIGLDFTIIDEKSDSAPKKRSDILLIDPPNNIDVLSAFSALLKYISNNTNHHFIAFVDSRKQTEYIATIATRLSDKDDSSEENLDFDELEQLKIFPYRAGYEEIDRINIQNKLSSRELNGVVSTAALELGIDIPYLTLGILFGMPNSATSFYQRIGRIGRNQNGVILLVNNKSILTEAIFRNPKILFKIPLTESTLYLENPRIQYIHTLCFARQSGENDIINQYLGTDTLLNIKTEFPENFIKLCNSERIGEISAEYQMMKSQAGEDPNHVFPLRDVDIQFKVEYVRGPQKTMLGSLSYGQLMREAYPGAVYYYQTQSFRVTMVNIQKRLVQTRRERKYTTSPTFLPSLIFPNLSGGNIYNFIKIGDLIIIESNIQVRETVIGYKERRGRTELQFVYPLNPNDTNGIYFNLPRFTRNYFTTGVILNHPSFNINNVKVPLLSEIIFESFLMIVPLDRQDVNFGCDKHRASRHGLNEGSRFISIFDQTYGSLRLTSRIIENEILRNVLDKSIELASNEKRYDMNLETIEAINQLRNSLNSKIEQLSINFGEFGNDKDYEKILLPNSEGLDIARDNEEFYVESIFFSRDYNSLAYYGKHLSQQTKKFESAKISVPIKNIIGVPGKCEYGYYNYSTGEICKELKKNA